MKVLMLSTSYPREVGDYAGNFVHSLSKKLNMRGLDVSVLAPHGRDTRTVEDLEGVLVRRFQYMPLKSWHSVAYDRGLQYNVKTLSGMLQMPFFLLSYLISAFKHSRKCDILHAHWLLSGFLAVLVKKARRRPVVLTLQGFDINTLPESGFMASIGSWVLNGCDAVIAVNTRMMDRLEKLGVDGSKVHFIPNGVDPELFCHAGREAHGRRIITAGVLVDKKGHKYLIEALKKVKESYPDVELTVVGDGPLRGELEGQALRAGVADNVRFLGFRDVRELPSLFASSDVFVLPSLSEGMPLVLLEAMSVGRAVVASNVDGVPDVIEDGVNGLLVEPARPDLLADALNRLLGDDALLARLSENARQRVLSGFTWDVISSETHKVYGAFLV
ncbi:MAG: glycosyltransferase [Candidatus Altiarchaeales archaeon]|nr:glycosyltransferase [Candidatus Altiarchaeales archaeon]MBD3415580.1 glycosyltransferase [Candidatus Altiarchaeales archaeon]